jgi:glycerophosphoryl diester phosphodiesterase
MINTAHKKGMLFHVWTINDESDMEKYLNMGVDGVMTDYPDKLTNVLKKLNKLK